MPQYPEAAVSYQELLAFEANGVNEFPKMVWRRGSGIRRAGTAGRRGPGRDSASRAGEGKGRAGIQVFVSYSHKDEELREQLGTHLKIFQRQGLIKPWHDRLITAGKEWQGQLTTTWNAPA